MFHSPFHSWLSKMDVGVVSLSSRYVSLEALEKAPSGRGQPHPPYQDRSSCKATVLSTAGWQQRVNSLTRSDFDKVFFIRDVILLHQSQRCEYDDR